MRRGFSIFLILFFGLGPLSALLKGSEDAWLPPCCRGHGAHHCAMAMRMAAIRAKMDAGPIPVLAAPLTCPLYPGMRFSILMPAHALTVSPAVLSSGLVHSLPTAHQVSAAHSIPSRAHAGRGPPATNLS